MELPADIRMKASNIAYAWAMPDEAALDGATEDIARALLAERLSATERAAKIADEKAAAYEAEGEDGWVCAKPIAIRLRGIAAAIRAQP